MSGLHSSRTRSQSHMRSWNMCELGPKFCIFISDHKCVVMNIAKWLTLTLNLAFRFWARGYFLLSDLSLIVTLSDLHLWRFWHCQKYHLWNWSFWQRQRHHSKSNRLSGKLGFDFGLELCWWRFQLCHSHRRRKCFCGYRRNLPTGHEQVLFLISSLFLKNCRK